MRRPRSSSEETLQSQQATACPHGVTSLCLGDLSHLRRQWEGYRLPWDPSTSLVAMRPWCTVTTSTGVFGAPGCSHPPRDSWSQWGGGAAPGASCPIPQPPRPDLLCVPCSPSSGTPKRPCACGSATSWATCSGAASGTARSSTELCTSTPRPCTAACPAGTPYVSVCPARASAPPCSARPRARPGHGSPPVAPECRGVCLATQIPVSLPLSLSCHFLHKR